MLDILYMLAILSKSKPCPSPTFGRMFAGEAVKLESRSDEENPVRETQRMNWTRTRLQPAEREDLMTALGSEQKAHLLKHDYVWVKGVGVLWKARDGALRRARFTHGTHFRTLRGEFYIDSEGSVRELSNHRFDHPASVARAPRAVTGTWGDTTTSGPGAVPTTRSPVSIPGAPGECVEHRT
jgi:hypothetical protein